MTPTADIPKRLLHIIKATGVAGAERHLLILLDGLRRRGLDAELLILNEPAKPTRHYVEMAGQRGIPAYIMPIHSHADITLVPRLRNFIRRGDYDAAHTHLIHADLYGPIAAKLAGLRSIFTTRHNDAPFRLSPPIRLLNRISWQMVDRGIAISEALREFCIRVEGAPPWKVVTVHYGIEPPDLLPRASATTVLRDELGLGTDVQLVGVVGRLIEQKGVTYAIRAFHKVASEVPNAHLVIAGDGPLRADLEAKAHEIGLAERIHFLGWRSDVPEVMAALDIFLMTSLWEGFGMVLLEAMSQSLPIIASNVSAIPEVVADGRTGLLVPPRDVDSIAKALLSLLADPKRRREMGVRGRRRLLSHFDADSMVERTLEFYRKQPRTARSN